MTRSLESFAAWSAGIAVLLSVQGCWMSAGRTAPLYGADAGTDPETDPETDPDTDTDTETEPCEELGIPIYNDPARVLILQDHSSSMAGDNWDIARGAIVDEPAVGLAAVNDSPTVLGSPTALTATVTAGSSVTYTWALGDGTRGTGSSLVHTYPAVGVYTAVVTASNSVSWLTATTTVAIEEPVAGLAVGARPHNNVIILWIKISTELEHT